MSRSCVHPVLHTEWHSCHPVNASKPQRKPKAPTPPIKHHPVDFTDTACWSMLSRVYETERCPSVRPSVCPGWTHCSKTAAGGLLPPPRARDIDWLLQRERANAGSAALRAYVGCWTQICSFLTHQWLSKLLHTPTVVANNVYTWYNHVHTEPRKYHCKSTKHA